MAKDAAEMQKTLKNPNTISLGLGKRSKTKTSPIKTVIPAKRGRSKRNNRSKPSALDIRCIIFQSSENYTNLCSLSKTGLLSKIR